MGAIPHRCLMSDSEPVSAVETVVFAGRLRWLRARAGVTRRETAAAAGIPVEDYTGLETGDVDWGGVTVATAHALLDALDVADEHDLLARVPTPPPTPVVPLPRRPDDQHPTGPAPIP